ncbi:MAG: hypothetical protein OEM02_12295 [Desulfobulbaceae bacterium]|nr:hypothetical protein [Desulfobulbaceae bacterium]
MPETKSSTAAAQKWSQNAAQATEYYNAGVQNPKRDWAQATGAAEEIYKTAVTKAATEGRFGKGVAKAGTAKWKKNAVELGSQRFGPGVAAASGSFAAAIAPVLQTIQSTDIGPRYAKGDPRNITRVQKLAAALHAAKTK